MKLTLSRPWELCILPTLVSMAHRVCTARPPVLPICFPSHVSDTKYLHYQLPGSTPDTEDLVGFLGRWSFVDAIVPCWGHQRALCDCPNGSLRSPAWFLLVSSMNFFFFALCLSAVLNHESYTASASHGKTESLSMGCDRRDLTTHSCSAVFPLEALAGRYF